MCEYQFGEFDCGYLKGLMNAFTGQTNRDAMQLKLVHVTNVIFLGLSYQDLLETR